tara:strand:- start:1175 stop:1567 length:393 start_codon:yes stop_codon:yes gene_type:complete
METVDNNFLFALMWYVMGIFSYKVVAKLLNYGNMINIYQDMLLSVLSVLKMTDDNYRRGNEFLKQASTRAGLEEESIALETENNENALNIWREMVIGAIILTSSPQFRRTIKFKNWNEAMRYLKLQGAKE